MVAVLAAVEDMQGSQDIVVEVLQPDTVGKQGILKPEPVRMDYMLEAFREHMRVVADNQA